jgi:hypothetical protein
MHLLWITKTLYFNNLSSYLLACAHLIKSITGQFPLKRNNLPPLIVWNSPFLQFWWHRCKNFTCIICKVQVSHFHWRDRYQCKSFLVFFDCGTTNLKKKNTELHETYHYNHTFYSHMFITYIFINKSMNVNMWSVVTKFAQMK